MDIVPGSVPPSTTVPTSSTATGSLTTLLTLDFARSGRSHARSSDSLLRFEPSGSNCAHELLIVLLVLVCIPL
jgi:hypothetical protein